MQLEHSRYDQQAVEVELQHVSRGSPFVCKPALFPVLRHQEVPLGILGLFVTEMVKALKILEALLQVKNSLQIISEKVLKLFCPACSSYVFFGVVAGAQRRPESKNCFHKSITYISMLTFLPNYSRKYFRSDF